MHRSRYFAPALAGFALYGLLAAAHGHPNRPVDAGVARAQSHLDSVLSELGARDVAALHDEQRARRAELLAVLRVYRDRGLFPHNYDFPNPTPYFVDRKTGTLCAVGQLLALTGRDDIVRRVRRSNNNAYVAQLAGDTAFRAWLDANGLTLAEAARIQIVYVEDDTPPPSKLENTALRGVTYGSAAASLVTSVVNATINSDGQRLAAAKVGLVSGLVSTGMGIALFLQPAAPRTLAGFSTGAGALSIAFALYALMSHHSNVAAARKAGARHLAYEASVAPLVAWNGDPGLELSIRF